LTGREIEIIILIALEHSGKEISESCLSVLIRRNTPEEYHEKVKSKKQYQYS
jgi:hypothetical protein